MTLIPRITSTATHSIWSGRSQIDPGTSGTEEMKWWIKMKTENPLPAMLLFYHNLVLYLSATKYD